MKIIKNTALLLSLASPILLMAGAGHDHSSHAGHDHSSHAELHGKSATELLELANRTTSQILGAASPEIMHNTVQLLAEITSELQAVIAHTEIEEKQRAVGMSKNLQKSVERIDSALHQEKLDQLPKLIKSSLKMIEMIKNYIPKDSITQLHDHSGHNHAH